MGVDDDALRLAQLGGDDVGGLARDPGQTGSSSSVRGTSPSNSSISIFIVPRIDFVFCRKKPVARMSFSSSSTGTAR